MGLRINYVRHVGGYCLELEFTDGLRTVVELTANVAGRGGVFAPFSDVDFFRQVRIEPEAGTVVWPNGVDLCPDVLYSLATSQPVGITERARM